LISIRLSNDSSPAAEIMGTADTIHVKEDNDTPRLDQEEGITRPCSEGSVPGVILLTDSGDAEAGTTASPDRCSSPDHTTADNELDNEVAPRSTRTSVRCASRAGTEMSEGSGGVDWDELEKTEEQEPRDEGSDEVCWPPFLRTLLVRSFAEHLPSRRRFFWLASSRKTTRWR
jgi:hypothetical protein